MSHFDQMSEETLEDVRRLNEHLLTIIFEKGDSFTSRKAGPDWNIRLLSLDLKYEFARPDVAFKVSELLKPMGVERREGSLESPPFICEYRVSHLMETLIRIACWSAKNGKTIHAKWIPAPNVQPNTKTFGNFLFEQFVTKESELKKNTLLF